tara:strand:+ start:90 stop:1232 length:1143 start_codon:yes stop_codon:yes gene_type:complete
MSRILKRPMFRRGGSTNTGIMSGLVDRKNYQEDGFVTTVGQKASRLIPDFETLLEKYTPETRLGIGEFGLDIASGTPIIQALKTGYGKFTKADDAREAAIKSGATKLGLQQAMKVPKDTRTDLEKKLTAAGYIPGTPEYQAAMQALIFREVTPKAGFKVLTAVEAKELLGPAYEEGKAYQMDMDPRSNNYKKVFEIGGAGTSIQIGIGEGEIQGKAARDKIINQTNFVERQLNNLDTIDKLLQEDPTLGGGVGFIRKLAFDTLSLGKDLNLDLTGAITQLGGEELLLNTNTARLEALEDILVPAFARVMNPNTRITNQMLNEAKAAINLTGLKGSEAVRTKLKEIKRQFEIYIKDQNALLGKTLTQPKKFKIIDGKLVEQ